MRNANLKLLILVVESMIRTWTLWSPGGTVKLALERCDMMR